MFSRNGCSTWRYPLDHIHHSRARNFVKKKSSQDPFWYSLFQVHNSLMIFPQSVQFEPRKAKYEVVLLFQGDEIPSVRILAKINSHFDETNHIDKGVLVPKTKVKC